VMGVAEAAYLANSTAHDLPDKRLALWESVVVTGGAASVKGIASCFFR
jgi:cell division ATPase FtsA